ncbi:response regulator [bacterium]|nr:response regulator [bacterium]
MTQSESTKTSISILLIEDMPSEAELVKRMLRNNTISSTVEWAQSLSEAKDLIQQTQFDLIVTDMGLPDSDGIETVTQLVEINSHLPIIALTGRDDDDIGLETIRAGASDFIPKGALSKSVIARAINHTIERYRLTETLKETNGQLEKNNERLAQMYKMSQQFVDNVSHEFRTPLTVIREFAAIVRDGIDGPVTEKQSDRLSTLISRSDDLSRMVDDLLDTSRLEVGLLKAFRREHDLSTIVNQVERMLRQRALAKKIKIQVKEIPTDTIVFCDEEKLRRTLINLLVNAIKFTPVEGEIEISVEASEKDRFRITVSDSGPGIPADELNRIFERFQQIECNHRMASCRGFGLGLSIARALASINLGSLEVASVEGEGSQFSVLVPVANMDSILRCYFDQRATDLHGNCKSAEISVVEVTTGEFNIEDELDVLETVDDFLMTNVKTFDLVLQTDKNRWLIYTCNSELNLPEHLSQLTAEWSKLKRNHFGAVLPELQFDNQLTTGLQDGRQTLMKLAVKGQTDSAAPAMEKKNKRILVVDDELEVAGALESRLQASGYEVSTAHDGKAGLLAVEQTNPHAILLDVRMPKMDGLSVLSHLKSNPLTSLTPVIVLSASLQDKQKVLDCGASYFIQKPFQSSSILSALDAVMQQPTDKERQDSKC